MGKVDGKVAGRPECRGRFGAGRSTDAGGCNWHEPVAEAERSTVVALTDAFSIEQLAAAYLRLYRERHTAPEELSAIDTPAKPREAFGPSVWFSLEGGRDADAEPRRLLAMLCRIGNLSKEDIGAIRIQTDR